jgi:hypothetical protein
VGFVALEIASLHLYSADSYLGITSRQDYSECLNRTIHHSCVSNDSNVYPFSPHRDKAYSIDLLIA